MEPLILINGQWQGGGNLETFDAAMQIQAHYEAAGKSIRAVPIDTESRLCTEQGILGCTVIAEQLRCALDILHAEASARLLTIGGGCDADVASIAYLNQKYDGELTVLWLDAHGDSNAPAESQSHLFYGMPLRALLGETPPLSALLPRPLLPQQIVLAGCRDLDEGERQYIKRRRIPLIPVLADETEMQRRLAAALKKAGSKPLYIHLDLDVLAPEDFPYTPLPVPGGCPYEALCRVLLWLKEHCCCVGAGLFEYKPAEAAPEKLRALLQIAETMLREVSIP